MDSDSQEGVAAPHLPLMSSIFELQVGQTQVKDPDSALKLAVDVQLLTLNEFLDQA